MPLEPLPTELIVVSTIPLSKLLSLLKKSITIVAHHRPLVVAVQIAMSLTNLKRKFNLLKSKLKKSPGRRFINSMDLTLKPQMSLDTRTVKL